jgi:hypothetical protein
MYYSYVEIEYVATSFSPARTDLALKLLTQQQQYHKRTTLRTMNIPLQSIRSEEGPHYCWSKVQ